MKEDLHMLLSPAGRRANSSRKKGAVAFEPQAMGALPVITEIGDGVTESQGLSTA